eukprot:TRINITY_DN4910_c4_g1_i1.p1 TRINITY_DN4910_c4_g1~~TRINITY_DN4910_c4_g1_i1.p1  ORF type:complete len:720 (+),score=153.97 TRINITY_DN4910_c4_g1_i1:150-2162(+)
MRPPGPTSRRPGVGPRPGFVTGTLAAVARNKPAVVCIAAAVAVASMWCLHWVAEPRPGGVDRGVLVSANAAFIGFGAGRRKEGHRDWSRAWVGHFRAADEWLQSAAGSPGPKPDAGDAVAVRQGLYVSPLELAVVEKCLQRTTELPGPAAALLSTGRKLVAPGTADPKVVAGVTCGGPCCPAGGCLFCSPGCAKLPENCSTASDSRAIRSVWRLRAARRSGRESTRAVGDVGKDWQHCALCGAAWAQEYATGQVERLRMSGMIPETPNTSPGGGPLWREGSAGEKQSDLSVATGGVLAVLYSVADVMVWRLLRSLCKRMPAEHPLILLFTAEMPPVSVRDAIALATTGPGCFKRQIWFMYVPPSLWRIDKADGEQSEKEVWGVSEPGGYRRMCWFWHRTIHWLPALSGVKAIMRLDTDSELVTTPREDPVAAVLQRGAKYGYVSFCFDNTEFTIGLWRHFIAWRDKHLSGKQLAFDVPDVRNCSLPFWVTPGTASAVDFCHVPMFYTNFEVLVPSFFREEKLDAWVKSAAPGIRSRRWGDAPLRALTLALFAREDQIVHLNDFAYRHGRSTPGSKSGRATLRAANGLNINWYPKRYPPHGDSLDVYFLGICVRTPLDWDQRLEKATPPPTSQLSAKLRDKVQKEQGHQRAKSYMERLRTRSRVAGSDRSD